MGRLDQGVVISGSFKREKLATDQLRPATAEISCLAPLERLKQRDRARIGPHLVAENGAIERQPELLLMARRRQARPASPCEVKCIGPAAEATKVDHLAQVMFEPVDVDVGPQLRRI